MKLKNRGYIVPVAIGVLVVASLGLLFFSWWGGSQKPKASVANQENNSPAANAARARLTANDDTTLDADSAAIDSQINALDGSNTDVNTSLSDTSTI